MSAVRESAAAFACGVGTFPVRVTSPPRLSTSTSTAVTRFESTRAAFTFVVVQAFESLLFAVSMSVATPVETGPTSNPLGPDTRCLPQIGTARNEAE